MNDAADTSFHSDSTNNLRDLLVQYNKELITAIKEQTEKGRLARQAARFLQKQPFLHNILEKAIPRKRKDSTKDKRYKKYKSVAKLFDEARVAGIGKVKNLYLLRILIPRVLYREGYKDRYIMVNSSKYKATREKYNTKLKNTMKWLNKHWIPIGYKAKFHPDYCEVIKIPLTATQS